MDNIDMQANALQTHVKQPTRLYIIVVLLLLCFRESRFSCLAGVVFRLCCVTSTESVLETSKSFIFMSNTPKIRMKNVRQTRTARCHPKILVLTYVENSKRKTYHRREIERQYKRMKHKTHFAADSSSKRIEWQNIMLANCFSFGVKIRGNFTWAFTCWLWPLTRHTIASAFNSFNRNAISIRSGREIKNNEMK